MESLAQFVGFEVVFAEDSLHDLEGFLGEVGIILHAFALWDSGICEGDYIVVRVNSSRLRGVL